MKKYIVIAFVVFPFVLQSQIINVENIRRVTDTTGWSGYTRLIVNLVKNRNTIFGISNRTRIQYKTKEHLWLLLNDLDFRKANENKLVSRNAQHFRYNYRFHPKFAFEAFLQSQTDEIAAIRFRGLIGSGIRFKISKNEKYKLYLGSLIMYEHENINSTIEDNNRDWRNSTYFSMSLYPKKNISIVSTTYFQPRFDMFSDFRISSQNTIAFEIFKKLMFTTNFTYQYDEFPVIGVPKEQYRLTNGLLYSF
ncbi:MAG: DUF481 domain-containing protein [Tenacibaculum sp.]|nr:DUF481 domain-containing protein [Tenacibaculum sp.]